MYIFFFFFFQAEDGIRDLYVTGVQTCALPISGGLGSQRGERRSWLLYGLRLQGAGHGGGRGEQRGDHPPPVYAVCHDSESIERRSAAVMPPCMVRRWSVNGSVFPFMPTTAPR